MIRHRSIGGSRLVRDYLNGEGSAPSFFAGSPFELASYRAKLAEVTERFGRAERERAASALRPTSPAAAERLATFVEHGGAMVTTGQQTGFLTGPLYTVYKALSAVALAGHLERHLSVTVLPVFWCASEDHDWEEVNHTYLLDPRGRLRRFTLPGDTDPPLPMSVRTLERGVEELCAQIFQYIAGQEDNEAYLAQILEAYRCGAGRTVAAPFGDAMAALLAPFDGLIADASAPALKEASGGVLAAGLVNAEAQEAALRQRTERLQEAGYSGQVAVLERGTNLFLHEEDGRRRLYRRGEDFTLRERRGTLARSEVLATLEADPTRFSPNVLLRPVVESSVFPTLAYVGGPGELAYFAQAGALFAVYGIEPPVAVPRYSATVVDPAIERTMGKLGLGEGELGQDRDALRDRVARAAVPEGVVEALEEIRRGAVEGYDRLGTLAGGMDPTLANAFGRHRNRTLLEARRAERKILRSIKRGEGESLRMLDRVLESLRPNGLPQDRVVNVATYLARYGDGWLAEVMAAIREQWRLPTEG